MIVVFALHADNKFIIVSIVTINRPHIIFEATQEWRVAVVKL